MRRFVVLLIILGVFLTACQSHAAAPATASATVALPTEIAPTEVPPTPSFPTVTASPPTFTPLPPETASFYRLRVAYSTTSDWSTLDLLTTEHVLTMRLMGTDGDPHSAQAGITQMSLGQPLEAAYGGRQVGLTVDYALDPTAAGSSLDFVLKKGDLNGSVVRLSVLVDGEEHLLETIDHSQVVGNSRGLNPLTFDVDLAPLLGLTPELGRVSGGEFSRLVWAFYYPWYWKGDWESPRLKDHPLEAYASSDRATILRHVRQAKAAGIDGFISSWWGPASDTDNNLRTLLDVAQDEDFRVSIYFETLTDDGPRPTDEIVRWLTYAIRTYRDHPAFAKVDGKPVIVLWASNAMPLDAWRGVLAKVRERGLDAYFIGMGYDLSNLEVFDGLHEYGVFAIPGLEQAMRATGNAVRYAALLQPSVSPKLWAATVQPGYDDRLIPGRQGLVQDRQDGAFYRRTWEAALASDPDWIFITTWNEWWEHTYIEPSQNYGELYLDITREYASRWKGN